MPLVADSAVLRADSAQCWGWLTYRVMTYDALAEHATAEERKTLMKRHRTSATDDRRGRGAAIRADLAARVWSAVIIFLFPVVLAGMLGCTC